MAADIDTLRILVATDCHVGYLENDEIRRSDSFNAFEEICSIASQRQVDFVLLGGDLFHENKPSRSTLVRTIEILRKYCMNDKPIQFQVVSDQTINFPNKFGVVNYEDPNFNVGLPVFTIHGNHDDPAGVDNLSAIDILSTCNLVNYFGKVALGGSGVGNIALHPILLRKGSTHVALYGLGNIRDERLNRMFQTPHAVQWIRPESTEDCPSSDWFNVFVLHQNRVKANPKNAINEHMLAKFLDFVIWGHEHECLVDPQEVLGMDFHITQPGSSVATSLIDGESKPKHVLLLEIKGNEYRPTKVPLKSVRPFKFKNVSLQDAVDLDANDLTAVLEYLSNIVQDLIAEAAEDVRPDPMLPLVRLRVDYTGFTTINPQRFGQKFVGKVANPHDILLFTKASKRRANADGKIEEEDKLRPEELNQQNIEALLAESNLKMEILPISELGLALHKFVNKDDKLAFTECLQENLDDTQTKLVEEALSDKLQEDDVVVKVSEHMQQREKEAIPKFKETSTSAPTVDRLSSLEQRTSQRRGTSRKENDADEPFSDDDAPERATPAKRKAPASKAMQKDTDCPRGRGRGVRGRGRARGSQGGLTQTTLNVVSAPRPPKRASAASRMTSISDDEGSESNMEDSEEDEEPAQKIKRTSTKTSQRGRKSVAATKRGAASSTSTRGARNTYIDDDVEDDDDDDAGPKKVTPTPSSQKRSSWGSLRG